ncbi:aldehyde dehydrogenase family protein [Streptomyces uncialis]|uniref:aldehyde dehydrogenase family protein n=1 Tax=Streptomyces uncialis TaxID=1048205 RepID=UPI0037F15FFD
MGPLVDHANADRVDQAAADAAGYAKILVRGGRITEGPLAAGAFVRASLVEVEDVERPIIQQEVFGPVATFEVFDDEADAISRADATEFGLAASVWSRDVDRPLRVGRELEAGTVWANTWERGRAPQRRACAGGVPGDQALRPRRPQAPLTRAGL